MNDTALLLAGTARVVSAYLGRNQIIPTEIPALMRTVFDAMSAVGREARPPAAPSD